MHFCFAESLQSALVGLKASGTPNKAAAQLAKPGLEPLVAYASIQAGKLNTHG